MSLAESCSSSPSIVEWGTLSVRTTFASLSASFLHQRWLFNLKFISLHEATAVIYKVIEGTELSRAAQGPGLAPQGPLSYLAMHIFMAPYPIYGRRSASSSLMQLDGDLLIDKVFAGDATQVVYRDGSGIAFVDLVMHRATLKKAISYYEHMYKPPN